MKNNHVAICGAGIAGVAVAYHLAVKHKLSNIVLIDRQQPLSYTTSKSGENFRDYWPQSCMASFSVRSIQLMKELASQHDDVFDMRFSGYDFISEQQGRDIFPSDHMQDAEQSQPVSADKPSRPVSLINAGEIRQKYPWLSETVEQVVHIPQAGAIDVYALGSLLFKLARGAGVKFVQGKIEEVNQLEAGGFSLVMTGADSRPQTLQADKLVLAGGPFNRQLASMLNIDLPITNVLQRKIVIPDPLAVIPRHMPFTIFADSQKLSWSTEEQELIASDPEYQWLLGSFPAGLHIKPESKNQIKLGWAYNREPDNPVWEPEDDFDFPNVVLRGASRFIPALKPYVEDLPTPLVQYAGYYSRTDENWPLIGPLSVEGAYTISALAGFGTMTACAAGELCAAWLMNDKPPEKASNYQRQFHPNRYNDPDMLAEMASIDSDGQL
jgi:glycine/D-amino acid oxidase-like deaminating enzyme